VVVLPARVAHGRRGTPPPPPPPSTPVYLKAWNTTIGYESRPIQSGRCFTRLRLPTTTAVKVVAAPSVVVNVVLVVPTITTVVDGDQVVRGLAPSELASPPQNPSSQCHPLLLLHPPPSRGATSLGGPQRCLSRDFRGRQRRGVKDSVAHCHQCCVGV
jgi:hypothetical protein